jgi:glycosyltransferase involved in cell wall biosynthesis
MYEPAWYRALSELGIKCSLFDCHAYTLPGVFGRIERRVLSGPGIARLRRSLVEAVARIRPDVLLAYQGHYFDGETIRRLSAHTFVVGYHNDDPFGPRKGMLRYRHLLPALRHYGGFHVYRECNVSEALAYGVPHVGMLRSYYLPWLDFPRILAAQEVDAFGCDVVFAGHVEPDLRVGCISGLVRAGVSVRIYGETGLWRSALDPDVTSRLPAIGKVVGEEYRKALSAAKIGLCFFSKWNRDEYTRRVFEIPACGMFLLSERTAVMRDLYREGVEAEFFSDAEELTDKVRFYLAHDDLRIQIAAAGRRRAVTSGHDVYSRMRQWIADISCWRAELRSQGTSVGSTSEA